jgi:hypothetical protein
VTCSRADVLRLGVHGLSHLRSSTSGQLPSSGPIAYLPPLARSFSHLWWSSHLFSPGGFFSVRTATTTTPPSPHGAPAPPRTATRRQDLRLAPSVRAAGPEPFFRKTGVTGPRGGLVPPPSIASLHHQHACASFTDAWVLLRQQCLDRRRCDTPHPPAVERHVCHRVGAYQPNRSEDDH